MESLNKKVPSPEDKQVTKTVKKSVESPVELYGSNTERRKYRKGLRGFFRRRWALFKGGTLRAWKTVKHFVVGALKQPVFLLAMLEILIGFVVTIMAGFAMDSYAAYLMISLPILQSFISSLLVFGPLPSSWDAVLPSKHY